MAKILSDSANSAIYAAFAIVGVLLILADLVTDRIGFKAKNSTLLLLFLCVCIISTLLNYKYGIVDNFKTIVWMSIFFFVFYAVDYKRGSKEILEEIKLFSNIFVIINALPVIISLWQYALHIGYVTEFTQYERYQGFIDNRLFGVFTDPNYAAVISVIAAGISAVFIHLSKSKLIKALHIANIIISITFILLTGSRTARLVLALVILLSVWLILRKELQHNKKEFISFFVAVFCSITVLLICSPLANGISKTAELIGISGDGLDYSLTREDVNNNSDISNSRFGIWKTGLRMFSDKPIFGIGIRNVAQYCTEHYPDSIIVLSIKKYTTVHSVLVQLLCSTGIVGTAIMLCFALLWLRRALRIFSAALPHYYITIGCIITASAILLESLLCLDVLFINLPSTVIFWSAAGYAVYFLRNETDKQPLLERALSTAKRE